LGVYQIARAEIQSIVEALQLDSQAIESTLRRWLFTSEIPETPIDSDAHWREIHAMGPEWRDLARIGLRYASMTTSEAEVEHLLCEQKDLQGRHDVSFGTQVSHSLLAIRHAEYRNHPF
jgi:hypothetical protein